MNIVSFEISLCFWYFLFADGWGFEESSVHQWIVADLGVANFGLRRIYIDINI